MGEGLRRTGITRLQVQSVLMNINLVFESAKFKSFLLVIYLFIYFCPSLTSTKVHELEEVQN